MISQKDIQEERPDPIAERVGLGIFTDREDEMDSLMEWVEMAAQKYGRSRALVSHRRHGKTAIMERLYNRLFWERTDVMPFYFEVGEYPMWLQYLAESFIKTFLYQFLAYRNRDASLVLEGVTWAKIRDVVQKRDEQIVDRILNDWEEAKNSNSDVQLISLFHRIPHWCAVTTGLSIIYMFDEFQRLDQLIYMDQEHTRQCPRITGSFATAAESSRAPMLIAGSQVTVLTQYALTGAMLGRVSVRYIDRLPLSGAAELVFKFAQRRKWDISLEAAYLMSRLVDGHPYYIWCLFHSEYRDCDLNTEEGIRQTLAFEVENRAGNINLFWHFHFFQNLETFNTPHARRLIVYLNQQADSVVHVEQIVKALDLPLSVIETNDLLQRLVWCDLVREESNQFYRGLSDPMLAWVIRVKYGWEIERLMRQDVIDEMEVQWKEETVAAYEEIIGRMQSELNYWVGHVGEVFVKKLMANHFKDQVIDGALYFSQPGDIQLSRFTRLFDTIVQPYGAPEASQIDIYAVPADSDHLPWIVEVKNWQKPVSRPRAIHFWESAQNLAEEKGHSEMIAWFHARSGFTQPAKQFMQEKGILYSDEATLTQMLQDFKVIEKWRET